MKTFGWILLCAVTLTAAENDAPRRLAARALGDTPMFSDLRELCDGIGGRPTGSPAAQRAIEWAARKFREAGLIAVTVEPFKIPNLWLPGTAEASATSPEQFPIRLAAAPFTASTNGTLEARLLDAGEGSDADFDLPLAVRKPGASPTITVQLRQQAAGASR